MAATSLRVNTSTTTHPTSKASPHSKILSPRPQSRTTRVEQDLGLSKVIGTTTTSSNAFNALPSSRSIGYIAGAVAVLAKVNDDGSLSQSFYHFRHSTTSQTANRALNELSLNPLSPSSPRGRGPSRHRDSIAGLSSFGSSLYDTLDSPGSKNTAFGTEKVKPLACLSISPNGKLLAAGEVGHKPRVLVFSLAQEAYKEPLIASLSKHTFGVRSLAFSPDSQLLASLGDVNDGYLYVWSTQGRFGLSEPVASNKCTTVVRAMAWMGKRLITVGTRHVKVWNVDTTLSENPEAKPLADQMSTLSLDAPKTLIGRSRLLGPLLDSTFTAVVPLTSDKAIICSEEGDICILDDNDTNERLLWMTRTSFPIFTATLLTENLLLVAGRDGRMKLFGLEKWLSGPLVEDRTDYDRGIEIKVGQTRNSIIAMAYLGKDLVVLDDCRTLQIMPCEPSGTWYSNHNTQTLSAHGATPVGIFPDAVESDPDCAFVTWAADGVVMFWTRQGLCIRQVKVILDQQQLADEVITNELKVVKRSRSGKHIISGDRYGMLRITNLDEESVTYRKAHVGDITDIVTRTVADSVHIFTAGRDRLVQVFDWQGESLQQLQTMNDHVGAVTGLTYIEKTKQLVSCSADRNIVIREFRESEVAGRKISGYISVRNIVLKATPLSMTPSEARPELLLVSTNDKQVVECDLCSGSASPMFKISDSEGSSTAALSDITQFVRNNESCLIAGVSNTDKSVRLYDQTGALLARNYGHTEGLTGICLVRGSGAQDDLLVTLATDGTIFIWQPRLGLSNTTAGTADPVKSDVHLAFQAPARRMLTSTELAQLQDLRAPEEKVEGGKSSRPGSPKRNPSKLSQMHTPTSDIDGPTANPHRWARADNGTDRRGSVSQAHASASSRPHSPASPTKRAPTELDTGAAARARRRKSLSTGTTSTPVDASAAILATEQLCRRLQAFRKSFTTMSTDRVPTKVIKELEDELAATLQLVTGRATDEIAAKQRDVKSADDTSTSTSDTPQSVDEERLIRLLESRVEARLLEKMGQNMLRNDEHVTTGGSTEDAKNA